MCCLDNKEYYTSCYQDDNHRSWNWSWRSWKFPTDNSRLSLMFGFSELAGVQSNYKVSRHHGHDSN